MKPLLSGVRVLEIGGRSAAVCGRLFAELGAQVKTVRLDGLSTPSREDGEWLVLNANKERLTLDRSSVAGATLFQHIVEGADLVVADLPSAEFGTDGLDPQGVLALNPRVVLVAVTPFGLNGARSGYVGSDLVGFHSSGIAHVLFGKVEDPALEPPGRPPGRQAAFVAGLSAACAAMTGLLQQDRTGQGQFIDVSVQEALALMSASGLAQPAFDDEKPSRRGATRGGSAIGPKLPASDGFVAISPREPGQWRQWIDLLGNPAWASEARFATIADRRDNYDELFDLMSEWSRRHSRDEITRLCQERHIPAFPFGTTAERLTDPQLEDRGFFAKMDRSDGDPVLVPRPPFGLSSSDYAPPAPPVEGTHDWAPRADRPDRSTALPALPLAGVRVLDFSWVIAGPTCTRYLSLMGADVIKVENPSRPDSSRRGTLHSVVGESKLGLSIDLKADGALDAVRRLLRETDVVVDNFATGVMQRLGLGYEEMQTIRPDIIQASSTGLGQTGPHAFWVAYGSLLDAYVGFLGEPDGVHPPKSGMAWIDPLCGLLMAFGVVAALWERDRSGNGRMIDFSMIEAVLWTMPEALVAAQVEKTVVHPGGNSCPHHSPHGVVACAGEDRWLAIAVLRDEQWLALCKIVPALDGFELLGLSERTAQAGTIRLKLEEWARDRDAFEAMDLLQSVGIPASATFHARDLFEDSHLEARGFYRPVTGEDQITRRLPGLPWRWGDGDLITPRAAPEVGQHNEYVLRTLAGIERDVFSALELSGALGSSRPDGGGER